MVLVVVVVFMVRGIWLIKDFWVGNTHSSNRLLHKSVPAIFLSMSYSVFISADVIMGEVIIVALVIILVSWSA